MRMMFAALVALCFTACLGAPIVTRPITGDDVTIFVHGYKGARLETTSGDVAWVNAGEVLSSGDKSIAYSFEGQRDFPRHGALTPNGPLTKITVLPGILEEDSYQSFMEWGRDEIPGFVAFAYDWRQDVRTSGAQLCAFIESFGPTKRVHLMAHSMGGLVTMECLRHGSAKARSTVTQVVFLAAAFSGAPGIWDDLITGSPVVRNRALLSNEALLTFPASWQLLPPKSDFLFDANGAPIDGYSADGYRWGLFAEDDVKSRPAYRAQLAKRIEEHAALWSELLESEVPEQPWTSLAFVGVGTPTQAGWKLKADGTFDLEHPIMRDGDGVVMTERATPWPTIHGKVIQIDAEHSGMLRDHRVHEFVRDFLTSKH